MPGLGISFGRGGATTAQQDLQYADCILIEGSSMAEAHPVGFRWVMKAREQGATVIHVDPRFSRTSACADIWAPIRAGTDIAFLGGLIRYVLEHERYFKEYVVHYTNASVILREDFEDTEDLGGFFSGWDAEQRRYDHTSWAYDAEAPHRPRRDLTLQHPRCVLQVLRRHYARYTPETVERVTGIPRELFLQIAEAMCDASGPEKTAAICYAVGWTQHSKGVQIIRAASVLQLLLGNIGRPGGGVLALRGHASIQGSTDIPTLYDILPGYMPMPKMKMGEDTLEQWINQHSEEGGLWASLGKFMVSLLKAYYGARATKENEFGFRWLPRVTRDHSHFSYFCDMADGRVEGMFCIGQNPAVGGQHARLERKALANLKWLVVRELVETETAAFWKSSPEVERGELRPEDIETEVFLFPAAGHGEKEGAFTNTQRLLQWREKAVDAPGDARSDAWFIHQLAKRLKAKAAESGDPIDEPLRALDWWYPEEERGEPLMPAVLAEINGWHTAIPEGRGEHQGVVHGIDGEGRLHHGPQVSGFKELKDDGSTACGCWIYSGVFGPDGVNRALRREPEGRYGHGWGFAWPDDRRILYNRASARPDGRPWSEAKRLIWWDEEEGRWTGHDVPDFPADKRPDYQPPDGATGVDAHPGDAPFLLHADGLGWLFAPQGLKDGPLPTHYEPLESPVDNALYGRQTNPPVYWFPRPDNRIMSPGDPRFPVVLTTFRLTEHHTAGGMSRFLTHLSELQPEMLCEMSPELAEELSVENGDWVRLGTLRGGIEARALVTRRMRPLHLDGRTVHQVAIPFHWGYMGLIQGGAANDLVALSGDPNVTIHEGKALCCHVEKGRLPRGRDFVAWHEALRRPPPGLRDKHPEEPPAEAPSGATRPGGEGLRGKSE